MRSSIVGGVGDDVVAARSSKCAHCGRVASDIP